MPDSEEEIDWAEFFRLYRPLALRVARGLAPTVDAAEELVQEAARGTFERGSRGEAFESAEHARNYFLRALRNQAVSAQRVAGRARRTELAEAHEPETAEPSPYEEAVEHERGESFRAVERALAELPESERIALRLRYLEGLPWRECAERTGEAISTLHSRAEAAVAKIRVRIGKERPST